MVMLAEFGTLSLKEVLAPAMEMAAGYPMEENQSHSIEANRRIIEQWEDSRRVLLPHLKDRVAVPMQRHYPERFFGNRICSITLTRLVEAEARALAAGKTREQAIMAAYERFYRGDIGQELVAATLEAGGLITMEDLNSWRVYIEEPVVTNYKGIDVYKLTHWVQGPVMLQTLNLLEEMDLSSMGYNSARYIHALYQAMNLAFADRDFYYGDPYYAPAEPIDGCCRKTMRVTDWN